MPIKKFIDGEIAPADVCRLNLAYSKALRMLYLVDRYDPVTELLAKRIIQTAMSGLTDPQEIAEAVVKHFRELK